MGGQQGLPALHGLQQSVVHPLRPKRGVYKNVDGVVEVRELIRAQGADILDVVRCELLVTGTPGPAPRDEQEHVGVLLRDLGERCSQQRVALVLDQPASRAQHHGRVRWNFVLRSERGPATDVGVELLRINSVQDHVDASRRDLVDVAKDVADGVTRGDMVTVTVEEANLADDFRQAAEHDTLVGGQWKERL